MLSEQFIKEEQERERLAKEADIKKRKELAQRRKLWRVTVHFDLDKVFHAYYIDNRTWDETLVIRERLFKCGLAYEYDPGTWLILPPHELKAIFVTNQTYYVE